MVDSYEVLVCTYPGCNKKHFRMPPMARHHNHDHPNWAWWRAESGGCRVEIIFDWHNEGYEAIWEQVYGKKKQKNK